MMNSNTEHLPHRIIKADVKHFHTKRITKVTTATRAGNEPSRSFKFHNHSEGHYTRVYSWQKVAMTVFTIKYLRI